MRHKHLGEMTHGFESIIGAGMEMRGEIELKSSLRVDGTVRGKISGKGKILVGKTGLVIAPDLRATSIVVGGEVRADLYATERVAIH